MHSTSSSTLFLATAIAVLALAHAAPAPADQAFAELKSSLPFLELEPIPVHREDGATFAPTKHINAAYAGVRRAAEGDMVIQAEAKATYDTSIPTVALANTPEVKGVTCTGATMVLTFDSDASANKAAAAWKDPAANKQLAFMVPSTYAKACPAAQDAALLASALKEVKNAQVTLAVATLETASLVAKYDITMAQGTAQNAANLNKRGLLDWFTKSRIGQWLKDALNRAIGSLKPSFSIGLNYDAATGRALAPIPLYDDPKVKATCTNCWANGDLQLKTHLAGTPKGGVQDFGIEIVGMLKGNIDLEGRFKATGRTELLRKTLFHRAMNPISIPGVVQLGPEIFLDSAISFEVLRPAEGIGATLGGDLAIPFAWSLTKSDGASAISPDASSVTFTPHPPRLTPDTVSDLQADISAQLIPRVDVNAVLFKITGIKLELNSVNTLGLLGKPKDASCSTVSIQLVRAHNAQLAVASPIFNKKFDLFNTGVREINCKFCKVCLPLPSVFEA